MHIPIFTEASCHGCRDLVLPKLAWARQPFVRFVSPDGLISPQRPLRVRNSVVPRATSLTEVPIRRNLVEPEQEQRHRSPWLRIRLLGRNDAPFDA
jgi:hypothetical protein